LTAAMPDARNVFGQIKSVYATRKAAPTTPIKPELPDADGLAMSCERLQKGLDAVNEVIRQHNGAVADFATHQQAARDAIKKHFLAEGDKEFKESAYSS